MKCLVVPVTNKISLKDSRSVIQDLRRKGIICGLSLCIDNKVEVWRGQLDGDKPHIKNKKSGAPPAGVICVDLEELSQRGIFVVWGRGKIRHEKK
ncbi:hypothetical protein COU00_03570 [Candidatus Falkowbacteria bacterium CG10_big_fil_rev_8_21_14_0_10_43_11]|uniref:Uncharacterized protein n=1 Tax=Candidatus Falkowbacteria bacterium CG10_big_fil_rev_8_21_14_0_10_43_11 TaxID=1974568 RepID=A0A2M6WLE8_9BACT|nr:MAG: hypothetical protein COU00_03570 [Candidatus Falkowbacteria bacterium CG10_big_fil_rev_8_21_14_0_10_43_11]